MTKHHWIIIVCVACLAGVGTLDFCHAAAAGGVHHDLDVRLFPEHSRLTGESRLRLPAAGASLRLFLSPQAQVYRVNLADTPLPFTFADGVLNVRLPAAAQGRETTLVISYAGRFADAAAQTPIVNEDPTYGVAAAITPQGTFLAGGSGWYPDPRMGDATWRLSLTAPPGYLAVTAGTLHEQITTQNHSRSVWQTDVALPNLTLCAGPYQVQSMQLDDILISTYFYAPTQDLAPTYLDATRAYLELYRDLFGPYPFSKFAVVENFFPTGYGFPSWTLLGSTVVRLPFIVETSLGHEIAHSWWGNGVRVDHSRGNWSEGLTTYVADYLTLERRSASQARDYRLHMLRDYASLVPPERDFALTRFLRRQDRPSQAVGYGKAAMVFHMLRRHVGEDVFWQGLRRMAETRMFQSVAWDDFADLFSELSGQNLHPFFAQWIGRPGAPVLSLHDVEALVRKDGWLVRGRLRQLDRPFRVALPLVLETAGEPVTTTLVLDGREIGFEMRTGAQPRRLLVDPDAQVFRRLHPEEIPASVNRIRGSSNLTVVIAQDLPTPIADASRLLLRALRRQGVGLLEEAQVRPEQLQDRDVLFIGLPRHFAAPLLADTGLRFSEDGFHLRNAHFSGAQTALFAAVTHPDHPDFAWAYFVPFSAAAATDAARRIPHYGRYSYLVFHQGEIRAQGIWEVQTSPLIFNFNFNNREPTP